MSGSEQDAASGERDLGQAVRSEAAAEEPGEGSPEPAGDASEPGAANGSAATGSADGEPRDGESEPSGSGGPARRGRRRRSFWRELPILIVVALLLAVIIKTYAIQAFFIPSGSMQDTLQINDRVLVNKLVYDVRGIHRGDIVVFNGDGSWDPGPVPVSQNVIAEFVSGFQSMFGFGHPGDILIKRVIGLPGDRVACCDAEGRVTVNGVPLTEQSYLFPGDAPSESRFNIVVQQGRLWVMGDHRSISDDSRDHVGNPGGGTIPESAVIGRAFIIIWPPSRWRILPIPSTFEQSKLGAPGAAGPSGDTAAALLPQRLEPSGPVVPLTLGFAAAIPLTWLQRRIRLRATRRRRLARAEAARNRLARAEAARRAGGPTPPR